MKLLRDRLESIDAADIQQLCADQVSEGTELELKSDLPSKAGLRADPWHLGKPVGEYARNQIADEIVAFANTLGGVVCIGVEESADHPKRAVQPMPLPRVQELARRIRQSVYDIIDPPLPILEAAGVELGSNGEGVVLLRVPPSRRRPHRSLANKEVFIRRADESVRVSMREIQELTLQAVSAASNVESTLKEHQASHNLQLAGWLRSRPGCGFHLVGMPTTPLDLGRVVGRQELTRTTCSLVAHIEQNQHKCSWPFPPDDAWRPGIRLISFDHIKKDRQARYLLRTDGLCELSFNFLATEQIPGLFAAWLLGGLGNVLAWIERVRRVAEANVEYALAVQLPTISKSIPLMRYGASGFSGWDEFGNLPIGNHVFPTMSIGPAEEFEAHLSKFDEDLWNLAGQDVQKQIITFKLSI